MKKLFSLALGLASFNTYANGCGGEYQAAIGTCRIIRWKRSTNFIQCTASPTRQQHTTPKKIIYHDVMVPFKFGALAVSVKGGYIAGSLNHGTLYNFDDSCLACLWHGSSSSPECVGLFCKCQSENLMRFNAF